MKEGLSVKWQELFGDSRAKDFIDLALEDFQTELSGHLRYYMPEEDSHYLAITLVNQLNDSLRDLAPDKNTDWREYRLKDLFYKVLKCSKRAIQQYAKDEKRDWIKAAPGRRGIYRVNVASDSFKTFKRDSFKVEPME